MLALVIAAVAAASSVPAGRQAAYDAAQAAYDRGDWAAAVSGFEPLLPKAGAKPTRSGAVIRARLARALVAVGRAAEARRQVQIALDTLPPGDEERPAAWLIKGDAERFDLDYRAAIDTYRKALREPEIAKWPPVRTGLENGLLRVLVTYDPAAALTLADEVMQSRAVDMAKDKASRAAIGSMRGQALLNQGKAVEALRVFNKALIDSGGSTTTRVSLSQVSIRGSAAVAAQLADDVERSRQLLAYAGQGVVDEINWVGSFEGDLPVCGGAAGLTKDDVAIVEFALRDDGSVFFATPTYANRSGDVGAAFARALREWKWNPADVKKASAFWRNSLRLQLGCVGRPRPDDMGIKIRQDAETWLQARRALLVGPVIYDQTTHTVRTLSAGNLKAISAPSLSPLAEGEFRLVGLGEEELAILGNAPKIIDAPPGVKAFIAMRTLEVGRPRSTQTAWMRAAKRLEVVATNFTTHDPQAPATAWVQTELALALEKSKQFTSALLHFERVVALPDQVLPPGDPVRVVAAVHLASLRAVASSSVIGESSAPDLPSAQQCSLVDLRPTATNAKIASSVFPTEAMRWGMDGYVRVTYDVVSDGHVTGVRPVVAYPPFVFVEATRKGVGQFRYLPPMGAAATTGCSGRLQAVHFKAGL